MRLLGVPTLTGFTRNCHVNFPLVHQATSWVSETPWTHYKEYLITKDGMIDQLLAVVYQINFTSPGINLMARHFSPWSQIQLFSQGEIGTAKSLSIKLYI